MPDSRKLVLEVVTRTDTKSIDGLGGKLQKTGANLTKFVTLPLLGLGAASATVALDAQRSADKLNAAYASMGSKSGKTLDQLNAQADAFGEATVFDDEGIREAQAALLKFGVVSGDSFDVALQAAADWAAQTGKDVPKAADILGRSLADPTDALSRLSRMGIVFTDSQKEQIKAFQESGDTAGAQAIILQKFTDTFGHANEVMQQSPAGQTAQAMEDLQNAMEDAGAVVLPVLASLAQGVSGAARAFTSLPGPVKDAIVVVGGIVAAVGPVIFLGGKLIGTFKSVGIAFQVMSKIFMANPWVLLAAAVITIATLIITNWDKIKEFLGKVWDAITKAVGAFVKPFAAAFQTLSDTVSQIWGVIVGVIKGAVNGIIDVINGLFGFLNGISIGIPEVNIGPVHVGGGTLDPFNIPLIPHLASGGIIDSPTLALIGEKGPEAVVPLDRMPAPEFHSHIDVRGEDPFIRNVEDLVRAQRRIAFLEGF